MKFSHEIQDSVNVSGPANMIRNISYVRNRKLNAVYSMRTNADKALNATLKC
jgi:hypothetical protein